MEVSLVGGVANAEGKYIEEVVAGKTLIRWDPSIANREIDLYHIDFVWRDTTFPLRMSFMKLVDTELEMRGVALVDQVNGTSIFIREKIVSLKKSLLDGAKVTMLRKSLHRVVIIFNGEGSPLYLTYGEQGK